MYSFRFSITGSKKSLCNCFKIESDLTIFILFILLFYLCCIYVLYCFLCVVFVAFCMCVIFVLFCIWGRLISDPAGPSCQLVSKSHPSWNRLIKAQMNLVLQILCDLTVLNTIPHLPHITKARSLSSQINLVLSGALCMKIGMYTHTPWCTTTIVIKACCKCMKAFMLQ